MNKRDLAALFKTSFKDWLADNAFLRATALTFFIILPLPSLLLIIVAFFAPFYGQTHATQIVILQITALAGPSVAELFRQLLTNATSPFASIWTAVTVVGFSLVGAIGAFAILRDTMDEIWKVKLLKPKNFATRIQQRIGPFILVSALGLIVIAWTVVATTLFAAIKTYSINGMLAQISVTIAQILLSFALSTLLFAIIYKLIPQVKVHSVDVTLPAVVTSIAFTATNYILGLYIRIFTVTSIVGPVDSLLIILLWIFILNLIVLFGAEISKVYAFTLGPHRHQHSPSAIKQMLNAFVKAREKIEKRPKKLADEPRETVEKS